MHGWPPSWRLQAAVLLGAALLLATREANRAPLEYHEAYVVETAQEMGQRGDWIVPYFNGEPRLRKPPLSYWLTALSGRLRGERDYLEPRDGRLPSALAGVGMVALVLYLGSRLYDRRTAWLAGVMSVTSMGFFHYTHSARTDMLYAFLCTAGLAAFVSSWRAAEQGRSPWPSSMLMWAFLALATLTKGPHVPAMFLLGVVTWAAIERISRREILNWLRPLAGVALYLALTVPWWLAVHRRLGGEGLRGTQLSGSLLAVGSIGLDYAYRLPQLLFPWFALIPAVLALDWRHREEGRGTRLLGVIVATTVLLFSVGSQQRAFYVLPALAPSIILIAAGTRCVLRNRAPSGMSRMIAWSGLAYWMLLMAGLVVLLAGFHRWPGLPPGTIPRLATALTAVLACGLLFLGVFRDRGRAGAGASVAAMAGSTFLLFWTLGVPVLGWTKNRTTDPHLAIEAARLSPKPRGIVAWSTLPDLYVYYARRPVRELKSVRDVMGQLDRSPETGLILLAKRSELGRLPETVGVEVIEQGTSLRGRDVLLVRLTRRVSRDGLADASPARRSQSARPFP